VPPAGDEREVQRDATVAILLVVVLQVLIAGSSLTSGWDLWGLPGWIWLVVIVPELALLTTLTLHVRRYGSSKLETRRKLSLWLTGTIVVINLATLAVLVGALLSAHEPDGGALLFKAATIWSTNVVAFGLLFWDIDAGGPIARLRTDDADPDFLFPQMDESKPSPAGWHARLFDYVYVSFTNSIAFSPTDTMPLTPRAKAMMMLESGMSAVTVLLVAARAVNILG
jgi:hypothetical protein